MTTPITTSDLTPITHNSVPVLTSDLLAQLYGTDVNNIQQNHKRNSGRFIEGKHFFKAIGEELKILRLTIGQSQISPKTRSLILWTERGAARHAKMLETDQAWEVFERLEDCYFNQHRSEPPAIPDLPQRFLVSFCGGRQSVLAVPDDALVMSEKEVLEKIANGELHVTSEDLCEFIALATQRLQRMCAYHKRIMDNKSH